MSKYCGHLSELVRSLDTFHSFRMKSQCFGLFDELFVSRLLRRCLPKVYIKTSTSPKNIYSEILPPRATLNWSHNIYFVISIDSLGRYWAKPKAPFDLGTIVIFNNGEAPYKNHEVTAWPHSWYATFFLYFSSKVKDCSIPANTLSDASSKSLGSTKCFIFLTAMMAASLQRLAKSAPLNPKVRVEILFE